MCPANCFNDNTIGTRKRETLGKKRASENKDILFQCQCRWRKVLSQFKSFSHLKTLQGRVVIASESTTN